MIVVNVFMTLLILIATIVVKRLASKTM